MKQEKALPMYSQQLIGKDLVNIVYNPDIEEHCHCFWEINFITDGNKSNVINGIKRNTDRGLICFLRPYKDRHYIKNVSETLTNHYDLYIFPEQMEKLCGLFSPSLYDELLQAEDTPCFIPPDANVPVIIGEVEHIKKLQLAMYPTAKVRFSSLIAYILGLYVSSLDEVLSPPEWIENLMREIENTENFSSFSLQNFISSIHYTHGHICREFKKYTNMTLIGYINNIKLEKSLKLLTHDLKIIDIANTLGYCSQSAFENAFKKKYGTTPGNWRKRNSIRK